MFKIENQYGENLRFVANESPLWSSVKHGYREIAELLISKGADINGYMFLDPQGAENDKNWQGILKVKYSLLSLSIVTCPELFDTLIAKGAEINDNGLIVSPLMTAAQIANEDSQIRIAQVKGNYNPNEISVKIRASKKLQIFPKLLKLGADINTKDDDGDTAVRYTLEHTNHENTYLIKLIQAVEDKYGYSKELRRDIIDRHESFKFMSSDEFDAEIEVLVNNLKATNSEPSSVSLDYVQLAGEDDLNSCKTSIHDTETLDHLFVDCELIKANNKQLMINYEKTNTFQSYSPAINFYELNIMIDFARFLNRPDFHNAARLAYDLSIMSIKVAGSSVLGLSLVTTPNIITKVASGNYFDAAIDAGTNIGLSAVTGILYVLNVPILSELSMQLHSEMNNYRTLMNLASLEEELSDPQNCFKSAESYSSLVISVSDSLAYLQITLMQILVQIIFWNAILVKDPAWIIFNGINANWTYIRAMKILNLLREIFNTLSETSYSQKFDVQFLFFLNC